MFEVFFKLSLALLIAIVNAVVIVAFWRQTRLRTSATNIYLTSLALCDLVTGLVVVPSLTVATYLDEEVDVTQPPIQPLIACKIIYTITSACVTTTACHLFLISADRYVKIQYDFFYIKNSTTEFAYGACVITYVLNVLVSAYMLHDVHDFDHGCDHPVIVAKRWTDYVTPMLPVTFTLVLPVFGAVLLNVKVYKIAVARKTQINDQINHVNDDEDDVALNCNQLLGIVIREHKTALIIMAINIGYLITWPLDSLIWTLFNYSDWLDDCVIVKQLHPWLGLCNSAFNPIILFVMHSDYRQAIMNRVFI